MRFDLGSQQPVGSQDRPSSAEKRKFLLTAGPFHCVRMGVERTAKVTRVVEMEWASRVAVEQTDAPSPDRRIG